MKFWYPVREHYLEYSRSRRKSCYEKWSKSVIFLSNDHRKRPKTSTYTFFEKSMMDLR